MIASCRAAAEQIAGSGRRGDRRQDDRLGRADGRAPARRGRRQRARRAAAERARRPRRDRGELGRGIAYWLGNALLDDETSLAAADRRGGERGRARPVRAARARRTSAISARVTRECEASPERIAGAWSERRELRERLGESPPPLRYVLTATGNVYEDVVHGLAVAQAGGDIVAVIRSTAQSLLDYVPYGPTTEGYGGTFATQANFRIMREALDEWSARERPLRATVELLLGPVHAGDRGDGRDRGLRQHGQRRAVRDPVPRHQPCARPDRPARLAHGQRLLRRRDQHRRGQLPAHRRRDRSGAVGDGLAVHQPPARARLGRARRADRARRRVRDRHARW